MEENSYRANMVRNLSLLAQHPGSWSALVTSDLDGGRHSEAVARFALLKEFATGACSIKPELDPTLGGRLIVETPWTLSYSDGESFTIVWVPSLLKWVDWDDMHFDGHVKEVR